MGGREWDEGKTEEEQRDTRRSQFKRGAYGGVAAPSRDIRNDAIGENASGWNNAGAAEATSGWDDKPTTSWAEESAAVQAQFDNSIDNSTSRWIEETAASAEYRSGRGGRDRGRGRGRGDRGGRGGRGRGDGMFGAGRGGPGRGGAAVQQRVPREEDFPALGSPAPTKTTQSWGKPKADASADETKPAESSTAAPDWMNTPSGDAWADDDAQPVRTDVKW